MHTTDTVDYGVVVRGEMTLELDDGQKVQLRQGDCIVQNGTRHRWRNPGTEPCLMALVSVVGNAAAEIPPLYPSRKDGSPARQLVPRRIQ